jgi:hypothetical protein
MRNPQPTGRTAEAYRKRELRHWEKEGRGSGTYHVWNGQEWRLDRKAERGKPVRYSWKSKSAKRGEGRNLSLIREQRLKNTTLDPKAQLHFGKGLTRPGPIHHAAAATLVGKMHEQFEKNLNPNWKPKDGPTREGKSFLRNLQNRLGIHGGDAILNLRHYPADDPKFPGKSSVHDEAHRLQRDFGINPEQDLSKLSNDDLYKLGQKTADAVKRIDEKLGHTPKLKTPGQAGAMLRGKLKIPQPPPVPTTPKPKRSPLSKIKDSISFKDLGKAAARSLTDPTGAALEIAASVAEPFLDQRGSDALQIMSTPFVPIKAKAAALMINAGPTEAATLNSMSDRYGRLPGDEGYNKR